MEELKKCPFCGGEDIEITGLMYAEGYEAACRSCGASVPDETMKQAIESWNTRSE